MQWECSRFALAKSHERLLEMRPVCLSSCTLINRHSNRRTGPVTTPVGSTDWNIQETPSGHKEREKTQNMKRQREKCGFILTFYLHPPLSPFLCSLYFDLVVCMHSSNAPPNCPPAVRCHIWSWQESSPGTSHPGWASPPPPHPWLWASTRQASTTHAEASHSRMMSPGFVGSQVLWDRMCSSSFEEETFISY